MSRAFRILKNNFFIGIDEQHFVPSGRIFLFCLKLVLNLVDYARNDLTRYSALPIYKLDSANSQSKKWEKPLNNCPIFLYSPGCR